MQPDSGASRVEITIERIKEIARTTMEQLQSEARSGSSDFRNTHLSEGAFGEVPKAQDYATQQEAAAAVFRDTIDGVLDDLAEFQQNLLASAEAHERNDEAVAAALTALTARYGADHQYVSQKEYDQGRHSDALKVPGEDDQATYAESGGPMRSDSVPSDPAPSDSATGSGQADAPASTDGDRGTE